MTRDDDDDDGWTAEDEEWELERASWEDPADLPVPHIRADSGGPEEWPGMDDEPEPDDEGDKGQT